MLIVCTSSTDPDLCSTGDAMMAIFGATTTAMVATTQEIDHVSRLIRRASGWAETFLGYPLAQATYSETLGGSGGRLLMLSRTPVRAVLRFFDATDTGEATEICSSDYHLEDRDAGFLARDQGWAWSQVERTTGGEMNLGLTGYLPPGFGRKPWYIEYVAGYVPLAGQSCGGDHWTTGAAEGTSTAATMPEDIRQAVAAKTAMLYSNPLGVSSRRVGDLAVEYRDGGGGPEMLLESYRRSA